MAFTVSEVTSSTAYKLLGKTHCGPLGQKTLIDLAKRKKVEKLDVNYMMGLADSYGPAAEDPTYQKNFNPKPRQMHIPGRSEASKKVNGLAAEDPAYKKNFNPKPHQMHVPGRSEAPKQANAVDHAANFEQAVDKVRPWAMSLLKREGIDKLLRGTKDNVFSPVPTELANPYVTVVQVTREKVNRSWAVVIKYSGNVPDEDGRLAGAFKQRKASVVDVEVDGKLKKGLTPAFGGHLLREEIVQGDQIAKDYTNPRLISD
jgi:hypothetical protein